MADISLRQFFYRRGVSAPRSRLRNLLQWVPSRPVSLRWVIGHPPAVLTQHNDNARTGAMLSEMALSPLTVTRRSFGKVFTRRVDGEIYAQPLVVSDVDMPQQGIRNVVYVATMHNSVYAFDPDHPFHATPFWHVSLGPSIPLPDLWIIPGCSARGPRKWEF